MLIYCCRTGQTRRNNKKLCPFLPLDGIYIARHAHLQQLITAEIWFIVSIGMCVPLPRASFCAPSRRQHSRRRASFCSGAGSLRVGIKIWMKWLQGAPFLPASLPLEWMKRAQSMQPARHSSTTGLYSLLNPQDLYIKHSFNHFVHKLQIWYSSKPCKKYLILVLKTIMGPAM